MVFQFSYLSRRFSFVWKEKLLFGYHRDNERKKERAREREREKKNSRQSYKNRKGNGHGVASRLAAPGKRVQHEHSQCRKYTWIVCFLLPLLPKKNNVWMVYWILQILIFFLPLSKVFQTPNNFRQLKKNNRQIAHPRTGDLQVLQNPNPFRISRFWKQEMK